MKDRSKDTFFNSLNIRTLAVSFYLKNLDVGVQYLKYNLLGEDHILL